MVDGSANRGLSKLNDSGFAVFPETSWSMQAAIFMGSFLQGLRESFWTGKSKAKQKGPSRGWSSLWNNGDGREAFIEEQGEAHDERTTYVGSQPLAIIHDSWT